MNCALEQCKAEINQYLQNPMCAGRFLIINAENYDDYRSIYSILKANTELKCIYASDFALPNGMPDLPVAVDAAAKGSKALIGLSAGAMLNGKSSVRYWLESLADKRFQGYGVVLVDHCADYLKELIGDKISRKENILFADGDECDPLPKIKLYKPDMKQFAKNASSGIPELLKRLETGDFDGEDELSAIVDIDTDTFKNSCYRTESDFNVYKQLVQKYPELESAKESWGSAEQWTRLSRELEEAGSFTALLNAKFKTADLPSLIGKSYIWDDDDLKWLYWLGLKSGNWGGYLSLALERESSYKDLERDIYLTLAGIDADSKDFSALYKERKELIGKLRASDDFKQKHAELTAEYLDAVKTRGYEIYYLTDGSDNEIMRFFNRLSAKDYTYEEALKGAEYMSSDLYDYMSGFEFNSSNIKLNDMDFAEELTDYFNEYKFQKFTNKIKPEFLEKVNEYAKEPRPYNQVTARDSVLRKQDGSFLYFIDALGAEYLAFIAAGCKKRNLAYEISVTRCDLPSITSINDGFKKEFGEDYRKVDDLDELKHHSNKIDYQKCDLPVHLPEELKIISKVLDDAQGKLERDGYEKVIIASDHGASRLAVLAGQDEATIALEEKGEHSGRCVKADYNPHVEYAEYKDGFCVLANYNRFKGGRRANLELHGGASLEEVLVPVITLTKKTAANFRFKEDKVFISKGRAALTLIAPYALKKPKIIVNGKSYIGVPDKGDKTVIEFDADIKRAGDYTAQIFDGDTSLGESLTFAAKKKTTVNDLL